MARIFSNVTTLIGRSYSVQNTQPLNAVLDAWIDGGGDPASLWHVVSNTGSGNHEIFDNVHEARTAVSLLHARGCEFAKAYQHNEVSRQLKIRRDYKTAWDNASADFTPAHKTVLGFDSPVALLAPVWRRVHGRLAGTA